MISDRDFCLPRLARQVRGPRAALALELYPSPARSKTDDGSLPPHLDGIFASLGSTDDSRNASLTQVGPASWNRTAWQREIEAMKALGMTFVVVPHLAHSITTTVTASCPSGVYGECSLAVTGAAALTADVAANRGVL